MIPRPLRGPLLSVLLPGCWLAHGLGPDVPFDASLPRDVRDVRDTRDAPAAPASSLLFVLVHPSDAPRGPGVYVVDEARQEILDVLPLAATSSPHGLAWDGRSLWVSDLATRTIFELDPTDGSVRSEIPEIMTEGIACDEDDSLWYVGVDSGTSEMEITHLTREGMELSRTLLPWTSVVDLALAAGDIYYLLNDDVDPILSVDLESGVSTELVRGVSTAPYSLAFDGTHLAVAVDATIRRYDRRSGALVSVGPLPVPGWITALAFRR